MGDRVRVDTQVFLNAIKPETLKLLRRHGNRVRTYVRAEAPRRTGELHRLIRLKVGWDRRGPYARIDTWAKDPRTGYPYALALQRKERYLERGLERTPRA